MKKVLLCSFVAVFGLTACNKVKSNEENRKILIAAYSQAAQVFEQRKNDFSNAPLRAISDYDEYYSNEYLTLNTMEGAYCYIKFANLLYENKNFPIIDKPVELDADWIVNGQVKQRNHMQILTMLNPRKNSIVGDIYCISDGLTGFIHIDMNYNFNEEKINELKLYLALFDDSGKFGSELYASSYSDSTVTEISIEDKTVFAQFVKDVEETYYAPYKEKLSDVYSNNLDFSAEYTATMSD